MTGDWEPRNDWWLGLVARKIKAKSEGCNVQFHWRGGERCWRLPYLITDCWWFNQLCLHNETSIKTPEWWGSESFWVGEYMEVLGKTVDTLLFFPPYFALCVSSIWLFLSWIFYNERVIVNWRRKWQPTPLFLPGKSHGQRSLAGYSPRGHKRVRHDLATKTTKQETAIVSKVFPWVLCAVPANHKPEERIVETPNFQPVRSTWDWDWCLKWRQFCGTESFTLWDLKQTPGT